jgi:hypothetical protein
MRADIAERHRPSLERCSPQRRAGSDPPAFSPPPFRPHPILSRRERGNRTPFPNARTLTNEKNSVNQNL